ncbi:MAG: NAD(P)-dependent glycerol-3-phosphate dehydrogenase, partial [Candidatus Omnitrophica bacterium]|nr:NAD(P)-dependent glycerol-3-phosphate dehydrogenase [Candidatus Omnitrophota bacterium]
MQNRKISILGDGGWGTTLSLLLSKKGFSVALWSAFADYVKLLRKTRENKKFLPGFTIPDSILITNNAEAAIEGSEAVILAAPSKYLRSVAQKIKGIDLSKQIVISVVKGIEADTFKRPSEIITDELGFLNIAVLSGPTIANEVAEGLPASSVAASSNEQTAGQVQEIFMTERFRVYTSPDTIGVELGGALKNIIAIAAGISDGLGFGTNAKAALFTRGLVEISRIGVALGAKQETFSGLSGMGDLVTTCVSLYSRNRYV